MMPQSNEQRNWEARPNLLHISQMASTPTLNGLCTISSQGCQMGRRICSVEKLTLGACGATHHDLSGGQMQRLAIARTFMRSSSTEQNVGLLLFDEPSASLDPTAEHGAIYPHDVLPFN
jgi:ABC-type phosphate/phosphonate transport system ATPase subunit